MVELAVGRQNWSIWLGGYHRPVIPMSRSSPPWATPYNPAVPYHVRITPTDLRRRQRDIVVLDKDAAWIETRIAAPRRRGESIFINGQTIAWAFIDEIHITETDLTSEQILPQIRALRRARGIATQMSDEWYVTRGGRDVTDEFISGAPGATSEDDTSGVASTASGEVAKSSPTKTPSGVSSNPSQSSTGAEFVADARSEPGKLLDFMAAPRTTAVIGIASLALSVVALVANAATLGFLGVVVAISFLVIEILDRRRQSILIVGSVLTLLAMLALARYYSNPGTTYFGYDHSLMSAPSSSPFADLSEVPLTADPSTGTIYSSIPEGDGGYTSLSVSCLQSGYFHHRQVLWAKIVAGPYESLWIPRAYLAGIEPGSARTILYCGDWRWVLQDG